MSIVLTVNNIPFEYPTQGTQSPWGDQASSWAEEVTKVLNSLKGPADILETAAQIQNNVSTPTDIPDFKFNPTIVRSFSVKGNITRATSSSSIYEECTLVGMKTATGWDLQQDGVGNSGVTFSITAGGQVQYTSSNFVGQTSGIIKFRGIGILNS